MHQIDEHFHLIDTEAFGRKRVVAAYVVEGEIAALVDMGYASSAEVVDREVRSLGSRSPTRFLIPTHVHLDHAGSVGILARNHPNTTVIVQHRGAAHLIDPSRLIESARQTFGQELLIRMGEAVPIRESRLRSASDEYSLDLGSGLMLELTWAPGHAPHQMIVHEPTSGTIITGDAVGLRYPDVPIVIPTTPPPAFDPDLAVETLQRIERMKPRRFLTPHFGVIEDVDWVIQETIRGIQEWRHLVGALVSRGETPEGVYRELLRWVSAEAGIASSTLPEHVKLSLRIDAIGFVNYFERMRRVAMKPQGP